MEPLIFILLAFVDEGSSAGKGVAFLNVEFGSEIACQAAIDAMPHDQLGDQGTNNGLDWAVCVPKS